MDSMSSPAPRRKAATGRRLACAHCQTRKIKCDRTTPCRQCVQAGLQCEEGNRKSGHGRSRGRRNNELRERLWRLETMFEEMNQTSGTPKSASGLQQAAVSIPTEQHPSPLNKYVGSNFWASLTGEVHAIREALAEPNDETEDREEDSPWTSSSAVASPSNADLLRDASGVDFILCAPARIYALPGSLPEIEATIQSTLLEIYIDRIDVAWKIFHAPTLRAFMQSGQHYLGRPAAAPCNRALRAAIYFAAISQISSNECEQMLKQPHARLLDHLRGYAEATLVQADVISSISLASLQAFAVWVATTRRHDTNHRSWALFGLLIRLARAGNLDRESSDESFFQQQLNRRLWHHLCCLDSFFAYDRGSEVSIAAGSYSRPFPSNINDEEFGESSRTQPMITQSKVASDMNFALMLHELYTVAHRLPARATADWQQQLRRTNDLHAEIFKKYTQHCDPAVAFQRLTIRINKCVQAINVLDVVRTGQAQQNGESSTTEYILELAVDVLRKCEELRQDVELAKWNRLDWVQWQPLAVILACLCSIRGTPLAEEAWTLVNLAMGRAAQHIADTTKGRLWQPLIKVYKKALAFRYQQQVGHSVVPSSSLAGSVAGNLTSLPTPPPVLVNMDVLQNAQLEMDTWQLQVQNWMLTRDDCEDWSQSWVGSDLMGSQFS